MENDSFGHARACKVITVIGVPYLPLGSNIQVSFKHRDICQTIEQNLSKTFEYFDTVNNARTVAGLAAVIEITNLKKAHNKP